MRSTIPLIHSDYNNINLSTSLGFSQIPEQIRQNSIKDGFTFNLLVVSRRGLGATTLINSLFSSPLIKKSRSDSINTTVNEIVENGIKLMISVTTYHGEDMSKVMKYINNINEEYFELEQGLNVSFTDKRIHCCIYLVPGDKITENEIEGLRLLSSKANIIPVITKADMYTNEELAEQREKINACFEGINFYDYEEQEKGKFPMAVIASEKVYEEDGSKTRGRSYPWGFIDIENEKFGDFKKMQRIIIGERLIDLINATNEKFYIKARENLIRNEGANNIRYRLKKILEQMEIAIDQNYTEKVKKLESDDGLPEFSDALSLKTAEIPPVTK